MIHAYIVHIDTCHSDEVILHSLSKNLSLPQALNNDNWKTVT